MDYVSTDRAIGKLSDVEQFFSHDVRSFKRQLADLEFEIDPQAQPERNDCYYRRIVEALEESREACAQIELNHRDDPVLIRDVQAGFRQETASWFDRSWIGQRARSKPSGFAGDHEMLTMIYGKRSPMHGFGGYLDTAVLDWPLARAVRARMEAIRGFLVDEVHRRPGVVRILDIACGPCREYLAWPEERIEGSVEAVVMDNDPLALDFVARQVVPAMPSRIQLKPTRYNALRTRSAEATIRKFGKFDIIYSVGLFDYLPDEQLIAILGGLRETLSDGGVMYIAFKDTAQYDQTWYQWHLDWFFFQRTHDACLRLFKEAGIDVHAESRDQTGIIMNFVSRNARSRIVRMDPAEDLLSPLSPHLPTSTAVTPND